MVQIYVSQLRKVLPAGVLATRAPGYLVEVAPEALDLSRFNRMRAEGEPRSRQETRPPPPRC